MDELAPFRAIPGNEHVLGKLKDLISSGNAIAFVGAGASAGKYPLWIPLLHELADLAVERDNAAPQDRDYWLREASSDPLGIAERIKVALGSGIFYSQLEAIFGRRTEGAFTDAHKRLASLPFKGFVTTNYDRGLVDAWQVTHQGAASKTVSTRLNDVATGRWLTGEIYRHDPQPILHAHGIIDDTKSMVLTLEDYKDAYRTGTPYRRLFERLIIQDNLVFVGFGFTDPWMFFLSQTILRDIRGAEPGTAPRHIAVIGLPSDREYTREQRRKLEQEYDAEIVFYPVEVSTASGKRSEDHSALAVLLSTLGPPDPSSQSGASPPPESSPRAGSRGPMARPPSVRSGPPFARRRVKATHESRFYFGAQRVPLLGRDKEKGELHRFLADEGRLRWWLMAGPGGIGKSRLALELVEDCGSEWDAGFFDQTAAFDWAAWSPTKPTLVVVDYVAQRPQEMGGVIRQLFNREDQLRHPVRFLMLERESEGRWTDEFYRTGSSRSLLGECRFNPPLMLKALTPQDLWEIIATVLQLSRRPLPDRPTTLAALQSVDPGGRPLFAAFLADALAAGRAPREWDMQSLVLDVLAREADQRWRPAGIMDQDLNLLALSTMVGGLPPHKAKALGTDGILPEAAQISPSRHAILTGQKGGGTLAPLEPDLIGEMFVLNHLSEMEEKISGISKRLAQLSWRLDPIKFAVFLDRSAADFARHSTLRLLDLPPQWSPLASVVWAIMATSLIGHYGNAGDVAAGCTLLNRIAALAAERSDEPVIRQEYARAAVNLSLAYGNASNRAAARELLDRLAALAAEHPDEPVIREEYARAAVNLTVDYGRVGNIAAARELVDRLDALGADHLDEPAIREYYARAAVNLMVIYGRTGDIEAGRELLDRIESLAANHPGESVVREQYANAAVTLTAHYSKVGAIAWARPLIDRLDALVADYPDEPAVRRQYARAALNLGAAYGNARDIPAARALLDRVDTLAADHPDEPAIREEYARAAFNLIVDYGKASDIPAARALLDRLDAMIIDYPNEPAVRELYGNAAVNLSVDYSRVGDIPAARELVERLDTLAADHPDESAMLERYARAGSNLSIAYCKAGDIPAARTLLERLDSITVNHPGEPEIRESYSRSAAYLTAAYVNRRAIPVARALVDRLDALAADYSDEPAVRERYARAAVYLIFGHHLLGNTAAARKLLERLSVLVGNYPNEAEIRKLAAEATVLLTTPAESSRLV